MGNTHSSFGFMFGSVIGGLVLAPFTGGASLAAVGIASGAGTVIGGTAFAINAANNRDAPRGSEMRSFLAGAVGGAIAPVGGMATSLGAEVTLGLELAGVGVGLGTTNAGDGKFKPYVGNQQEAVKYYTQKEERINTNKKIQKETKEETMAKIKLLLANTTYKTEYIDYLRNVSGYIRNKNIKRIYEFVPHKITNDIVLHTLQNNFKLYDDNPQVDRLYVIRRKLDCLPVFLGWMAHSGLLLSTTANRWFICEYGTEANKNNVCLYEVTNSITNTFCSNFQNGNRKWHKQICGSSVSNVSINSIKETMESKTCMHSYWLLFWNCHMAQEATRESLGLNVENKYMEKNFDLECTMLIEQL